MKANIKASANFVTLKSHAKPKKTGQRNEYCVE